MGQKVTIGGDRLGAGKKMQTELHNYGMSTHNLDTITRTTAAPGVLIPTMVLIGERDDHFKINIAQDVRTQPTVAPLFGSFKLQTDVFMCPMRLYQGLLHNNPTELGRKMNQVKLPKITVSTISHNNYATDGKLADNCLIAYCGMRGLGRIQDAAPSTWNLYRKFNATPMLAYYDIFKNYYSNKQEEDAYVISAITNHYSSEVLNIKYKDVNDTTWLNGWVDGNKGNIVINWATALTNETQYEIEFTLKTDVPHNTSLLQLYVGSHIKFNIPNSSQKKNETIENWIEEGVIESYDFDWNNDDNLVVTVYTANLANSSIAEASFTNDTPSIFTAEKWTRTGEDYLNLTPFPLENIDRMRYDLLTMCELGKSFEITGNEHNYLPYGTLVGRQATGETLNKLPLNGLCVKTYQNDLFNNWINAEWIDGENGVSEISKIVTQDGAFTIDALQFAKKIYNLYNRITISGATYYDWQNVVWSESRQTHVENPVYVGGYAAEICFEEVVNQTALPAEMGEETPLGQLGGKGKKIGDKGGYIEIDCEEACVIMAITSITPRISYTQGNEWYMTELDSIDDLHKPEMDGIGFQDLLGERLAWWDAVIGINETTPSHRTKIGKVPAWIEYQTNYDRTFGEFADIDKAGYMVLTRQYDYDEDTHGILDVTTYIDPSKYNYAFAVTDIDAQNFWLQCNFDVKARRRMSAHLIPQA